MGNGCARRQKRVRPSEAAALALLLSNVATSCWGEHRASFSQGVVEATASWHLAARLLAPSQVPPQNRFVRSRCLHSFVPSTSLRALKGKITAEGGASQDRARAADVVIMASTRSKRGAKTGVSKKSSDKKSRRILQPSPAEVGLFHRKNSDCLEIGFASHFNT